MHITLILLDNALHQIELMIR